MTDLTLGAANSGPKFGPVIISELMANPPAPDLPGIDPSDLEYVELHNPTSASVDISDWQLREGIFFG